MRYARITINTDGGARGNPGPAAIGITAQDNGNILFEIAEYIGETTNNVAEYTAVIHALDHLKEHTLSADEVSFILDSELIVRQILGIYRVKEPHLQTLVAKVRQLVADLKTNGGIGQITFSHVKRNQNRRADQLVNQSLDSHQ